MPKKLSIICPIYKVKKYIPALLESLIIGVNDPCVEIIFINDCCPEGSMLLCQDYISKNLNRIKFSYQLVNHKINYGIAATRNTGLALACGKYIGFIDSDDLISKNYLIMLSHDLDTGHNDIIEFGYREFSDLIPEEDFFTSKITASASPLNPFINL